MVATCSPGRDNPSLAMTSPVVHRMENAVATILHCIGEDPQREGLRDTPKRVAKAWMDLTRGENQNHADAFGTAFFHEPQLTECPGGLVLVRDISFSTLSSSTLLPFYGNIHVAYIPSNGVILGLSKLARVTRVLAARLQSQERLTQEVLCAFAEELDPQGAAVICSARHLGAPSGQPFEGTSAPHISCAAMGSLKAPERLLELEILLGLPMGSALLSYDDSTTPDDGIGPLTTEEGSSFLKSESIDPKTRVAMASAVQTLLSGVLEARNVPNRHVSGVQRYVDWIWHATSGYRMPMELDGASNDDGAATPSSGSSGVSELMDFDLNPPASDDVHMRLVSSAVSSRHLRSRSEDAETSSSMGEDGACRPVDPGALMASLSRQQRLLSDQTIADMVPSTTIGTSSRTSSPLFAASSSLHVTALPFSSDCEHHLLPFHGTVGVAIDSPSLIPARVLRHIVDRFAWRLQVQERLGNQIADAIWEAAPGARACLVVVQSAHMCMVARGVEQHASSTMTTAPRGEFVGDAHSRLQALRAILHAIQ